MNEVSSKNMWRDKQMWQTLVFVAIGICAFMVVLQWISKSDGGAYSSGFTCSELDSEFNRALGRGSDVGDVLIQMGNQGCNG